MSITVAAAFRSSLNAFDDLIAADTKDNSRPRRAEIQISRVKAFGTSTAAEHDERVSWVEVLASRAVLVFAAMLVAGVAESGRSRLHKPLDLELTLSLAATRKAERAAMHSLVSHARRRRSVINQRSAASSNSDECRLRASSSAANG